MIALFNNSLPVFGLLGIGFFAVPVPAAPGGPNGVLMLKLPRKPAADESLALRLSVGVLPQGARVVVKTPDGKIAGTVSPFGVRPGRKAGVYTIPIPATAVTGDKVILHLEVLEKGTEVGRPPTKEEIEGAEVAFMPAPRPKESGC
jgi:hypothetical protein